MSKNNLKPVPELLHYYHFWDDGKVSPGRHYICRVEGLLTQTTALSTWVKVPIDSDFWPIIDGKPQKIYEDKTLYNVWKEAIKFHDHLLADNTDYFVEISCPEYDDNLLYAVRTKNGGWFTLDIQSWWQGGILDVTGEIFEDVTNSWEVNDGYIPEDYVPADEEHYLKRF